MVCEKGVTLPGPQPNTIVDPRAVDLLRREIFESINGWGQEALANPDLHKDHFYQTFIVSNYCRMLHDLHNEYPGSKLAVTEWAQHNLDPPWSALIDRAWDGPPNPAYSARQPADTKGFESTLKSIQYIREKGRQYK